MDCGGSPKSGVEVAKETVEAGPWVDLIEGGARGRERDIEEACCGCGLVDAFDAVMKNRARLNEDGLDWLSVTFTAEKGVRNASMRKLQADSIIATRPVPNEGER